jgi:pyruvate kinase
VGHERRRAPVEDAAHRHADAGRRARWRHWSTRADFSRTTVQATYQQLPLVWGVVPVLVDRVPGCDAMLAVVRSLILKRGLAKEGDCIGDRGIAPVPQHQLIKVEKV